MQQSILTINAGSSSVKFALFELAEHISEKAAISGQIDGIGTAQGIPFPVAIGRIAGVPGGGTLRGKAEFHAGSFRGAVLRLVCDDPLPSGGADDLRRPVHDACDLLGEEPVPVVVEVNAVGVIQLPPVRGRRVQVDGVPTLVTDQRLLYGM
mgnify:CR=1 FL=1